MTPQPLLLPTSALNSIYITLGTQEILQQILAGLMHSWYNPYLIQYSAFYPLGLKSIRTLGLKLMVKHGFNHNFNNCVNPICTCSLDIESTVHFFCSVFIVVVVFLFSFLRCNYYSSARISLLNDLNSVDRTLLNLRELSLVVVLLCSGLQFEDSQDTFILNSIIKYILIFERFSGRLFWMKIEQKYFIVLICCHYNSLSFSIWFYPFSNFIWSVV